MASEDDEKNLIKWLNALIAMAQWDASLPFYFARLFNQPKEYSEALRHIRDRSKTVTKKAPAPKWDGTTLNQQEWETLYEKTTSITSLRNLFAGNGDPFQKALPAQIFLLAEVSDLTTTNDPEKSFYSQNGAFHLVLAAVRQAASRQGAEVNMKSLIGDCFHKFYTLFDTDAEITEELYNLACSDDWYPVLASLKDTADYTTAGSQTYKTLDAWNNRLTPDLRKLVLSMFQVPRTLVKLAWERQELFKEARVLVAPGSIASASLPQDQRTELREQVSNAAHKVFVEKAQTEVDAIEADLKLLAVIARHYISARKFVKLDGLVYSWPRIASLAMANYSGLRYVEDLLLTGKPAPNLNELEANDARELYELCANNRAVIRFLKLHPRFKEIDPNELRRYRRLAPGDADTPAPSSSTITQNVPTSSQMPITSGVSVTRDCELVIKSISRPGNLLPEQEESFELLLRIAGSQTVGKVTFSIRKLLDKMLAAIGVTSEDSLHNALKGLLSGAAAEVLIRAGKELFSAIIIESGLEKPFTEAVETDGPMRLIVIIPSILEELHFLPWEWFPRPGYKELLLSNPRFSIVRSKPVRSEVVVEPLAPPVRVLGVFPNAPFSARDVSDSSINELETLRGAGAQYRSLIRAEASLAKVTEELEKFRPQVVHFEGNVRFSTEETTSLRIYFSTTSQAGVEPVGRPEFEALLKANRVQLLVVGQNQSKRVYGNAAPVLSSRLVRMAIPAVVAPIRAVDEVTATAFNTEFYRALLAGNTLEQALFFARQSAAAHGGDWTPFALFSDPWILDDFKPLPSAP
jgi:CHAT domain